MKFKRKLILVVLILFSIVTITFTDKAMAEEGLSTSFSLDAYSNYVWRGRNLSKGFVFQPAVDIIDGQYGFNAMANFDIYTSEFNEFLFTLNYMYRADDAYFDLGLIYYYFPAKNHKDTIEGYATTKVKVMIDVMLTLYYDFDEGSGAFLVSEFSYSIPIGKMANLKLASEINTNMSNEIMGKGTNKQYFFNFYNCELRASFIIKASDNLIIEPIVAYSFPITKDAELNIKEEFYFGVSAKMKI
jgi:hypothetical protein